MRGSGHCLSPVRETWQTVRLPGGQNLKVPEVADEWSARSIGAGLLSRTLILLTDVAAAWEAVCVDGDARCRRRHLPELCTSCRRAVSPATIDQKDKSAAQVMWTDAVGERPNPSGRNLKKVRRRGWLPAAWPRPMWNHGSVTESLNKSCRRPQGPSAVHHRLSRLQSCSNMQGAFSPARAHRGGWPAAARDAIDWQGRF